MIVDVHFFMAGNLALHKNVLSYFCVDIICLPSSFFPSPLSHLLSPCLSLSFSLLLPSSLALSLHPSLPPFLTPSLHLSLPPLLPPSLPPSLLHSLPDSLIHIRTKLPTTSPLRVCLKPTFMLTLYQVTVNSVRGQGLLYTLGLGQLVELTSAFMSSRMRRWDIFCVGVCVCKFFLSVCVYMRLYMPSCADVCVCVHLCAHLCVGVCVFVCVCMCACVRTCGYASLFGSTYVLVLCTCNKCTYVFLFFKQH